MEQSKQVQVGNRQDEVTLKDVVLNIRECRNYLLRKWKMFVVVGIAGAALGLLYSLLEKTKYVGELTFVLEENQSNPLSAYAGLASQFGFDFGAGGGVGVFSGDNIMEFLKSRLMVEKTLLSPVNVNGKTITLADFYIGFNEFNKGWEEKPLLRGLHFPLNTPRSGFSLQQDSILNEIQKNIVRKNLTVAKPDKKLSFIAVRTTCKNELFSKVFTERLVKEATEFYVQTKIKRSKVNVDKLQLIADSLEQLLNRRTYSLAATQDLNLNPARQMASVKSEVQARDKMVLQTMYGEVIKNLELSKMAMAQETPIVQVVDTPILPLKKERLGKLKGLILGGLLSVFLMGCWLVASFVLKKAMK